MFITALFIIARKWKQPSCPSADEWIRKRWYIYTMEYYSAIKKNTFELVLMRWMKLELIIQSEVSQKEKHQYRLSHIISQKLTDRTAKKKGLAYHCSWRLQHHSFKIPYIYMSKDTVLVFFFLAYFTLYNRFQFHPSHQN